MNSFYPHDIHDTQVFLEEYDQREEDPWTIQREGYLPYADSDYDDWRPYDSWLGKRILVKCVMGGRDLVAVVNIGGRRPKGRLRVSHFRVRIEFDGTNDHFFTDPILKGAASSLADVKRKVEKAMPQLMAEAMNYLQEKYSRPRFTRLIWKKDSNGDWQPFASDLHLYGHYDDFMTFPYGHYRTMKWTFGGWKNPGGDLSIGQIERFHYGYGGKSQADTDDVSAWRPATWFPPSARTPDPPDLIQTSSSFSEVK